MFGLDPSLSLLLILCLIAACAFEFVNGFHDTANAVATVIYTNTLKPSVAVIWSGIWNFLGVIRGGIDVAMGIVLLLPMEALAIQNGYFTIAMILALLGSAIIWNVGTWYFGIPCSSSHTLIGSIIGVGLAFSSMPENTTEAGVNWSKASDIGMSLLLSPLIGFGLTILMMLVLQKLVKNKAIFSEPNPTHKPPVWIRAILVLTCTGVSYSHGNNDGQKGVGLIMVILICLVPLKFALNEDANLEATTVHLKTLQSVVQQIDAHALEKHQAQKLSTVQTDLKSTIEILEHKTRTQELTPTEAASVRAKITGSIKKINKLVKASELELTPLEAKQLKAEIKEVQSITDYAPKWVVVLISLSLGLGTMIGWKRIVLTIGEKIGKSHLTYAQGASAELLAASTIYAASGFGLPVSTTQVLTSAVAGSMVAQDGVKNLQASTLKSIAIAWLLTLPVCIVLGAGLFYFFRWII